jgi:hypothetical protein
MSKVCFSSSTRPSPELTIRSTDPLSPSPELSRRPRTPTPPVTRPSLPSVPSSTTSDSPRSPSSLSPPSDSPTLLESESLPPAESASLSTPLPYELLLDPTLSSFEERGTLGRPSSTLVVPSRAESHTLPARAGSSSELEDEESPGVSRSSPVSQTFSLECISTLTISPQVSSRIALRVAGSSFTFSICTEMHDFSLDMIRRTACAVHGV